MGLGTGKKGTQVSDTTSVGESATCEWQAAALDKETSIAFYFEITNQQPQNLPPGVYSDSKQTSPTSSHSRLRGVIDMAVSTCLAFLFLVCGGLDAPEKARRTLETTVLFSLVSSISVSLGLPYARLHTCTKGVYAGSLAVRKRVDGERLELYCLAHEV